MKVLITFVFFLCSIHAFADNGKPRYAIPTLLPDTSVLSQILALPLQSYIGKPVDSLLSVLPGGYTSRGFMPMGIGYAKGVYQSYFSDQFNNCFVEIFVDTFQYMTFPNRTKTTTWDMTLAKRETIAFIKVFKNNVCIYGCNNSNYYD